MPQQLNEESAIAVQPEMSPAAVPTSDEGISLIDLVIVLLRRKRLILGVTLGVAVVAAIVVFLQAPTFKAEATVLPPQQQQSSLAALSGALGGLAGNSSVASSLGLKNPADLYVGILQSRTIADAMIDRFHLMDEYKAEFRSAARKTLAGNTTIAAGKDSMIKISVEDHDPKRAADMANAYIDELYRQNSRIAITDASQRRLFFEGELSKEKDALANAEIALKNTQQSTGLLAPAGQAEVLLRSGAQLRAEIASREVQLQALSSYATDENAQVQLLKKEIGALQGQLAQLENTTSGQSVFDVSAGKLPQATLEYIRKARDLKYHEALFELLAKQYEAARIDESKQGPLLQVVDRAVVPDRKSGPHRLTFTIAAAIVAFLLASGWVFAAHFIAKLPEVPGHAAELANLSKALRF